MEGSISFDIEAPVQRKLAPMRLEPSGACSPSRARPLIQGTASINYQEEFTVQGQRARILHADSTNFLDTIRTDRKGRIKYVDSQVLNYNAEALTRFDVFALSFQKAAVMQRSALVKDILLTLFFAVLLTLAFYALDEVKDQDRAEKRVTMFAGLVNALHGIMTFLLGFYLSTAVGRWWALRNDCIGGLWGVIDDLSLQLAAYFPSANTSDTEVRMLVLRWGVLSHELIYKQARGDSNLQDLLDDELITEAECRLLQGEPSKPQVVWSWVASYFAHLAYGSPEHGGSRLPYPAMILPQIQAQACKARGCIGQAFAYTDTQVPFTYVHLLGLLTWIHNFVQVINSANIFAVFFADFCFETGCVSTLMLEVFFLLFYTSFFLAILHVCQGLLNPLRSAAEVDFPRRAFTHYMCAENLAFHRGGSKPPYGAPPTWPGSHRPEHLV